MFNSDIAYFERNVRIKQIAQTKDTGTIFYNNYNKTIFYRRCMMKVFIMAFVHVHTVVCRNKDTYYTQYVSGVDFLNLKNKKFFL